MCIGQAAGMPVPRMYYTNFKHAITEKYHVVLEGWPLEKLCSPIDIQSQTEISVLMKSLESGATRFRKLSSAEFEQWSEKISNANAHSTTGMGLAIASSPPPSSLPAPSPSVSQESASTGNDGPGASTTLDPDIKSILPSPSKDPASGSENLQHLSSTTVLAKRKHTDISGAPTSQRPLASANAFVNAGVTSANGATVMVMAKVRKPRADKGKKRGPRAK